jgi:hypothetical protein
VSLSPGGGHGWSWSSVAGHGELAGEGKEGEGEEGEGGGGCSYGAAGEGQGCHGEGLLGAAGPLLSSCSACCTLDVCDKKLNVRKKRRRTENKMKKYGKFSKLENF